MKTKELKQKLSRLQSKAYNLQLDISSLISELEKEDLEKEKWVSMNL